MLRRKLRLLEMQYPGIEDYAALLIRQIAAIRDVQQEGHEVTFLFFDNVKRNQSVTIDARQMFIEKDDADVKEHVRQESAS